MFPQLGKYLENIDYYTEDFRMTPANGAVFLLMISLIKFVADGPIYSTAISVMKDQCLNHWWSYFLYIQNYVNPEALVSIGDGNANLIKETLICFH